jgi:SpoVK/Ycf46/Vps4 family AAA+-type ATPase
METSLKIEDLAKLSDGYSGSDVKDICQSAQLRVVDELFQSGKGLDSDSSTRCITETDFKEILKMRRPSVSMDMIRAYMRWSEQFKAL